MRTLRSTSRLEKFQACQTAGTVISKDPIQTSLVLLFCPYLHVFDCTNCNRLITMVAIKSTPLWVRPTKERSLCSVFSHTCVKICCKKRRNKTIILKCVLRTFICESAETQNKTARFASREVLHINLHQESHTYKTNFDKRN
jgi:hypothetical protein